MHNVFNKHDNLLPPSPSNWTVVRTHGNCVEFILGDDIPIEKCKIKILSGDRNFVEEETASRKFEVCLRAEEPLYAQLSIEGHQPCTKFIEKSGTEFYNALKTEIN